MCQELPVIPVNKVLDPKRIIGKNGGLRIRRGTRVADPLCLFGQFLKITKVAHIFELHFSHG
jgi:hypothetical protein